MFAAAEIAKLTKEEYRSYVENLNSYRDYKNVIAYAREEGRAEGKAEGLAEGEAKGEAKGKAEGEAERAKLQQEIEELKRLLNNQNHS